MKPNIHTGQIPENQFILKTRFQNLKEMQISNLGILGFFIFCINIS